MKKHYEIERVTGLSTPQLPARLTREIGRIIVRWAYFEHCVQEMVWGALNVSPAAGRIAVREPRVIDRLDILRDVIKLRGGEMDWDLLKSMLERARLLAAKRDLLAHGMWHHHATTGEWLVQLARGSWPKDAAHLIAGSKKVTPESVPMDAEKLRAATSEIDALIDDLKRLRASAVEEKPSP